MPKRDLIFSKPLMNAAGALGFAMDLNAPVPWEDFGAFITNPISLRPRTAAEPPRLVEYPGGVLIHSGLPNPGFGNAVTKYAHRWAGSPLPTIIHLMADRPEETREMVQVLEGMENVMAVELGFAPLLADDIILLAVEMSRGELPLIICLQGEQVLRLGPRTLQQGATAISLAAPRGTVSRDGRVVSGRLFGPSLFPTSLGLVYAAVAAGLPTIGAGGVFSKHDADAMVAAGAIAVQVDAQLWLPND
jgi:dihydroorotate dehydrogenase (NAD+) catalytic subunit